MKPAAAKRASFQRRSQQPNQPPAFAFTPAFTMNTPIDNPPSAAQEVARTAALLAALEHVQAVIEFDLEGRVLRANQLFLDLMGYTAR